MNERVAKSEAFLTPMTLPSACLGLTLMEFTTFRYVLQSNFGIKLQTMQKFSLLQQGTFNMTMMTFFGKKKKEFAIIYKETHFKLRSSKYF